MKKSLIRALAAGFALALALTLSCSSLGHDSDEDNPSSSSGGAGNTFTDSRDSKVYKWVEIGGRTWMAENLNYAASGSKCYGEIQANCVKYGRLYDWETAKASCPIGWHLPTYAEWEALIYVDEGYSKSIGTKLKSKIGWDGTDDFGFSALPGGVGNDDKFTGSGKLSVWWSATEYDDSNIWTPFISGSSMSNEYVPKSGPLLSVRCVQDVESGTFTDSRDSKVYKWVKLGGETWMAENLNYDVPSSTIDACYENKTENCNKYGRLYDWETAMASCPVGWHLPSSAEWDALINFAGNYIAGASLKSKTGWNIGYDYTVGTDDFGFSALPAGGGNSNSADGGFDGVGSYSSWWTSGDNIDSADFRLMEYDNNGIRNLYTYKFLTHSVRCVQNRM